MSLEVAYIDIDTPVTTMSLERHHPRSMHQFVPAEGDEQGERGWLVSQESWLAPVTLRPIDVDAIAGKREIKVSSRYLQFVVGIAGFTEPSTLAIKLNRLEDTDTTLAAKLLVDAGLITEPSCGGYTPKELAGMCLEEDRKRTVEIAQSIGKHVASECFYVAASSRNAYMNQYHTVLGELVGVAVVDTLHPSGLTPSKIEPVLLDKDNKPGLFPVGLGFRPYFYDANTVYNIVYPITSQATAS